MFALSVRQPWAWLILYGKKDFENRSRRSCFVGNVLIHASRTEDENYELVQFDVLREFGIKVPDREELDYGGIVGIANFGPYTTTSESKWAYTGGYPIEATQVLQFTPCKGRLGFWGFPDDKFMALLSEACGDRFNPEGFYEYWLQPGRYQLEAA